jgi:hypothetical protein
MVARSPFTRIAAWLMAASLLLPAYASSEPKPKDWSPSINPADFSGVAEDNQYFPLPPGRTLLYRGSSKDGTETLEFEVTNRTKTIMGVTTTVVVERHGLNGQTVEISENWFAQHRNGDVWYFGEFSQNYENGAPINSDGSWEAGVGGALPGIIMKANPQLGDIYFQEFSPGVAEDMAQVMSTSGSSTVSLGSYSGVLQTKEWTALEPNSRERKYYAPGIGLILEEKGPERLELIEVRG